MIKYLRYVSLIIILLLLGFTRESYAQGTNVREIPKVIPPSPNAAALGVFGQVPVSMFNGLAQVNIPLGQVAIDGVNVNIGLDYHGGGINPDHHPGWVGLGWNLSAGGMITRRVAGDMDEIIAYGIAPLPMNYFSYYNNYSDLSTPDWAGELNLRKYIVFNQPNVCYPAPDEFIFNFGTYSGSFYYDHTGKWQVKSQSPVHMRVEEELKDDYSLKASTPIGSDITLKRIFYKFTLTTPDGCKYIFGGTPESIEFTRDADHSQNNPYNTSIVPTSWYLTQIITRNGRDINFKYERDKVIATQSLSVLISGYIEGNVNHGRTSRPNEKSVSIINPVYLSEISAADQKVRFARSRSNELPYTYGAILSRSKYGDLVREMDNSRVNGYIEWKKLDTISFYADSSRLLKKVVFNYKEKVTSRLILSSVLEVGAGNSAKMPYQFTYNETPLPGYNSGKIDHWGYYNGVDFFGAHSPTYKYSKANVPAYKASRESDTVLMKAGVLTGIKYPTGGTTTFEYEPHEYRAIAKRYPFTVEELSANVRCGGLRVKKNIDTDIASTVTNVKEYLYVKGYNTGGSASSESLCI